jgi:tRNA nucleotidyltransferase (CCA-adding enzyme)
MAVDKAVELTEGLPKEKKLTVMLAVLLHDIAKPQTTRFERGHIRSPEHEEKGREPSLRVLDALNVHTINGYDVREQVVALVTNHLKPSHFYKERNRVSDGAFRRLARRCDLELLYLVSKADALARGPASESVSQEWFIERARLLGVEHEPPKPILMGRHLLQIGLPPGPQMGKILKAVYERQLDGEVTTLEAALEAVQEILNKSKRKT